jgi:hypothetical protein
MLPGRLILGFLCVICFIYLFVHVGLAIWNKQVINLNKMALLVLLILFFGWIFYFIFKDLLLFLQMAD